MANKKFLLGMLVLALGLVLGGCATNDSGGDEDLSFEGTWHRWGDGRVFGIATADNGNFTWSVDMQLGADMSSTREYKEEYKGTYDKAAKSPVLITITSHNTGTEGAGDGVYNTAPDNWVDDNKTFTAIIMDNGNLQLPDLAGDVVLEKQ